MRQFPRPIQNLTDALTRLPGVGPKTALRYVYFLIKQPRADLEFFAKSLLDLHTEIRVCKKCFAYATDDFCGICKDAKRDEAILCIVAESRDVATIEATGAFSGRYFVLGGQLNPIEGFTPNVLNVSKLIDRIKSEPQIKELILAFSPDVGGETTMLYLIRELKSFGRKITRLARGLPMGADLEFADEVTLGEALQERRSA